MQFEEVIEIIELTDSDTLSDAVESFNQNGKISDSSLPFLNVVFELAPDQLCNKLAEAGCKGKPAIISRQKQESKHFIIYDKSRFKEEELS